MSSILKALKKLEEEKASHATSTVVRAGGQFAAPAGSRRWHVMLLVCGIGAGLLLAAGLYLLFVGHPEMIQAEPLARAPVPVAVAAPATNRAAVIGTASVAATATNKPVVSVVDESGTQAVRATHGEKPVAARPSVTASNRGALPVAATSVKTTGATPPPAPPKAVAPEPLPYPGPAPTASRPVAAAVAKAAEGTIDQVEVPRSEIPAPGQQWAASHLTVSEILPDSGGGRMAIVNDLPVMEGTIVEAAVVKEIHPDRVLFVIDGKSVVVPLAPR